MLNNLKSEYTRKGIEPYKGIMNALDCSEKTAKKKLNGQKEITLLEALTIMRTDFNNDGLSIEYLFREEGEEKCLTKRENKNYSQKAGLHKQKLVSY